MKAPSAPALRGLWAALNVAEATPVGGDFTEANMRDIDEAIIWLQHESTHSRNRAPARERAMIKQLVRAVNEAPERF